MFHPIPEQKGALLWVFCRCGARFFQSLPAIVPRVAYNGFMKPETALLWWYLNILPNRKRYDMLIETFGSLDEATRNMTSEMLRELGCKKETILEIFRKKEEFDPKKYETELQRRSISLISIEDDLYPGQLKTIEDAPVFMSYHGDMSVLNQPLIALVGTRNMSSYGKRVAGMLVPDLVRSGVVTVSGLALGIDAEVARETMRVGGKTVAVLGGGLGAIYPKTNELLAQEIVKSGGLLISEFPLHMTPERFTFPSRNRIIAGLSLGTVVLEAAEKSGAIITAELALDYNRSVFSVPGSVFDPQCNGCHALISKGEAKLISSAHDILLEVGIMASDRAEPILFNPGTKDEECVWKTLTTIPQGIDELVDRSGVAVGTISTVLTIMELQGVVKNIGGGQWVKS